MSRRWIVFGLLLGAGLLALVWDAPEPTAPTERADVEGRRRSHRPRHRRTPHAVAQRPPAPDREVPRRDLIDAITVSPEIACVGEDVLVTTELTPHGQGARVVTGGQPGRTVAVHFDRPGAHEVRTVANAWDTATDHEVTVVEVEVCEGRPTVGLTVAQLGQDRMRFTAHSPENLEPPLRYRFEFGDGAPPVTGGNAVAEHDYTFRPVHAADSSFLVRLSVEDANGRRAERMTTVHFVDTEFLSAWMGTPVLPARAPLFPEQDEDELVLPVSLTGSALVGEVALESVRLTAIPCGAGAPEAITLAAADALSGGNRLRPGQVTTHELRVDRAALPASTCDVEVRIEGNANGLPTSSVVAMRLDNASSGRALQGEEAASIRARMRELGTDRATYAQLGIGIPSTSP